MQPRNLSLGVAKQLGLDRPGEGRQARAGALCALACVIFARLLRKEVLKRMGRAGREKKKRENSKAGLQSGLSRTKRSLTKMSILTRCVLLSCLLLSTKRWGNVRTKRSSIMMTDLCTCSRSFSCISGLPPVCDSLESLPQDRKCIALSGSQTSETSLCECEGSKPCHNCNAI